jgi:superfamily I DNA/RNA helicase
MRVLANVRPTSEQLVVINDYRSGPMVIRGAAGSGKTTTAVLRLRHVVNVWHSAALRTDGPPVRVLVLSYNRTLRGYVEQLVRQQVRSDHVDLTLDTFAGWAKPLAGHPEILGTRTRQSALANFGAGLALPSDFLAGEVDYVLGRYPADGLAGYTNSANRELHRRHGRGQTPAMNQDRRLRLLSEVIEPYQAWKAQQGVADWNDVALDAASAACTPFDVVVVDESQDFSANMVRAVLAHLGNEHSVTFVLDATQRVYPHGFTWREVGLTIRPQREVQTLRTNHRNTQRVAALARPLVEGLPPDDDGQLPDFAACEVEGDMPIVVRGRFAKQMDYIIAMLQGLPDDESVALLHPMGGGWFKEAIERLDAVGLGWVDLQRRKNWPSGSEEIGLSTLHSVKGLEFDHVVLMGLEDQHMRHGNEDGDTRLAQHRRLLAMAIGRARRTVTIAYKPETKPDVLDLLDPTTYQEITL